MVSFISNRAPKAIYIYIFHAPSSWRIGPSLNFCFTHGYYSLRGASTLRDAMPLNPEIDKT